MRRLRLQPATWRASLITLVALCIGIAQAHAEPAWTHALTLYGTAKYPASFTHFDYVNPDAPRGGNVKLASPAGFDSLNPFIVKGMKAPAINGLFESLMVQSQDEPQTYYGLVAEQVRVAEDFSWAEFTIRKQARFHDGSVITPEDIIFSLNILKSKGDPAYQIVFKPVTKAEKTGEQRIKFTFDVAGNRELPLLAAQLPILSKAYYTTHDFTITTLTPPLGSGPYKVKNVEAGRSITYERLQDYWGEKLPVNVGQNNFDTIRYDVYRDETVALEALKAGAYDFREEYISRNWATSYNNPAITEGRLIKREIRHSIPSGMQAFIFNTRRSKFSDRRVREAIDLTMDFTWVNKTLFYGAYERNTSFFQNTAFAAKGTPEGDELALLAPFKPQLPSALFTDKFTVPETDGSGDNRANLLKADALLKSAGWIIKDGKRTHTASGEILKLEFLLRQPTFERVVAPMRKHLKRLGIEASIRIVDDSQYQKRVDAADFDIVSIWINRGIFFPGNEQMSFWHSSQAAIRGSNNIGGIQNPVIDAILERLAGAKNEQELLAAGRALDRILLWEHYTIPHWRHGAFRVAYWDKFGIPAISPQYALGFASWWWDTKKAAKLNQPQR